MSSKLLTSNLCLLFVHTPSPLFPLSSSRASLHFFFSSFAFYFSQAGLAGSQPLHIFFYSGALSASLASNKRCLLREVEKERKRGTRLSRLSVDARKLLVLGAVRVAVVKKWALYVYDTSTQLSLSERLPATDSVTLAPLRTSIILHRLSSADHRPPLGGLPLSFANIGSPLIAHQRRHSRPVMSF